MSRGQGQGGSLFQAIKPNHSKDLGYQSEWGNQSKIQNYYKNLDFRMRPESHLYPASGYGKSKNLVRRIAA
jgi:hypothetical protein